MKNNYNVIGDVAGNFLTLQSLLTKMPQDAKLICLGDPNDRGPRSKEVIEFLMNDEKNNGGRTVQSNHAHMMTEAYTQAVLPGAYPLYYDIDLWPQNNGGVATMKSYDPEWHPRKGWAYAFPKEHINFLKNCSMFIENEDFFFSHAPLWSEFTPFLASQLGTGFASMLPDYISRGNLLWNRYVPDKPHKHLNGKINIFGHNSSDAVKFYTTSYPNGIKVTNEDMSELLNDWESVFAIAMDTSGGNKLSGLHLPTMTIYEQEYID
jgi:hypothetical protein